MSCHPLSAASKPSSPSFRISIHTCLCLLCVPDSAAVGSFCSSGCSFHHWSKMEQGRTAAGPSWAAALSLRWCYPVWGWHRASYNYLETRGQHLSAALTQNLPGCRTVTGLNAFIPAPRARCSEAAVSGAGQETRAQG